MRNLLAILAFVLTVVASRASAQAARWDAAPQVAVIFENPPSYPGVHMLELNHAADGSLSGQLTSDWYGAMPMRNIAVRGRRLSFDIRNINTPKVPARRWTAEVTPDGVLLTGGIWYASIRQRGRMATDAEHAAHGFRAAPLPALGALPPDGLAQRPPMGWSSWNKFAEHIDDRTVREIADAMVATGLRDAGYVHVNIDDGWQGTRGPDGRLRPNAKFPDMKALADYVHARGLKLGIYSSPGPRTCAGYEGSYGHVAQDARTFADWGVDYLKYDLCSGEWFYDSRETVMRAYLEMGAALRATGRAILYSLCEYGRFDVGGWGRQVGGHLWRTTGDITDDYPTMADIGFVRNARRGHGGPGGWNDPDMLEIGNGGMSDDEYVTHMSLWAISAAPLMMGHDVRKTDARTLQLLTHREVIAIDQDPLGIQGRPVRKDGDIEIWTKPLADGSVAVGIFNRSGRRGQVALPIDVAGIEGPAVVRDVWLRREIDAAGPVAIAARGAVLLRVRRAG